MNYILGGGISGFVVALYFRTFTVVMKGKGQDAMTLGPKILRKTEEVDSFIDRYVNRMREKDGKQRIAFREYSCGYYIDGAVQEEITEEQKEEYLKKTRGESWKDFAVSGMNSGQNKIEGYDMGEIYGDLLENFDLRTRRIFLNIKKINHDSSIISGTNPVHKGIRMALLYNKLINTLPAPLFNSLIEGEFNYKMSSQIYICIIENKSFVDELKGFDFVYYPEPDIPYYRATPIDKTRAVLESRKPFLPRKDIPGGCRVIKGFQLPFGKITEGIEPEEIENIVHIGRYARNDNDLRLHDIIARLERKEVRV